MTLEKFRDDFQKIKVRYPHNIRESLISYLACYKDYLPEFPQNHKTTKLYDCPSDCPEWLRGRDRVILVEGLYYTNKTFLGTKPMESFIDPLITIGHSWLYSNQRTFDCPDSETLAALLLQKSVEEIAALPANRAGGYYECTDGNHRIYAAYLLNRQVKISCEYEYRSIYDVFGCKLK